MIHQMIIHNNSNRQVLSDSFEELHDEEKQCRLLDQPCTSLRGARKKKSKAKDIADLVHQTNRWYTRDWEEVEAEINRMTTEFKGHLARKQEAHERAAEKKAEKRQRKNKRIKRNLNYLYDKYGIDPSDDSDSDEASSNSYDYLSYVPEKLQTQPCQNDEAATSQETGSDESRNEAKSSEKPICWLCKRSFVSDAMLQIHYEKSDLHRRNVEEAANPWNKFKKSFSEVKDPT